MDIAKVYVRNTGQNALTSLSVYVNDEPATYNVTTPIAAGGVGTITIYSFIPDGATVKVTSPNGFSASKVATPCSKAVGCWKFDEGSGTTAYDSSPYGSTGTLLNGAIYTSGKYGTGLLLDGSNDYVSVRNDSSLNIVGSSITISAWIKPSSIGSNNAIVGKRTGAEAYALEVRSGGVIRFGTYGASPYWELITAPNAVSVGSWYYVVGVYSGSTKSIYVNGAAWNITSSSGNIAASPYNLGIGSIYGVLASNLFNGTIDEVRIYNRAIY
jgi:hypothetical protein